jgi:hypothetical protein
MSKIAQSFSQKVMPKKLVMGFLVAAATVLVGTASVANATTGSGYGGTDINVNVNGSNNVVHVIINYFFG